MMKIVLVLTVVSFTGLSASNAHLLERPDSSDDITVISIPEEFVELEYLQHDESTVRGKVNDSDGYPIPGVTVQVKGTTIGVITDFNGEFSLVVPTDAEVLVFSFVGMISQEVIMGDQIVYDIVMEESVLGLDEIVVIGYGTQRRADVTSAVATVRADEFLSGKVQDAAELIKGKVAGLSITKSSGDPTETSTILLRGVGTLSGNVAPLVLIDGIPGTLDSVTPENIESIDVLKDASAAAIYGTRGANGVIIITTRSGRRQEQMSVTYAGYGSVSDFLKTADFMTPGDVRRGLTAFSDGGWNTDWLKAVTRKGITQNHSLSISGGTESTAYSANFSYRDELGTIKKSDNEVYRMQFDITQFALNDVLKFNLNILKGLQSNSATNASNIGINNIYRQAVIRNPTSPIYDEETGEYYEEFGRFQYYNPVAMVNELFGGAKNEWTQMTGNITVEPIRNWQSNVMLATHRTNRNFSSYTTSKYYLAYTTGYAGAASKSFSESEKNYLELTSRYDFNINQLHRVSTLAGYSYSEEIYSGFSAGNADFPTDSYFYNNIVVGGRLKEGDASMNSYKNDNKLIGFFGRLSYAYDNRFNLLTSVRREGSSQFGANHQWGVFPAASVGWTISNEEFMESLVWMDNLKIRAGYGVTGVIPVGSYASLTTYTFNSSFGSFLDENGVWRPGLEVTQNPNPNLKWETTTEFNIGVDFIFLYGRISGALDFYKKETNDLLYDYNVPVPPNIHGTTLANVGSLENRGVELLISGIPLRTQNFEWRSTLTASHNKNKLLSLSDETYETEDYMNVAYATDPISVPTHRVEIGRAIGNFWGLKSIGITEDGFWLIEDPQTGDALRFSTALNSDDYRQYLGNGFPKVYMGWNNTFRYRNFDLDVQMSGQFGFKILNEQRMFYENNSIQYNRLRSAADLAYGVATVSPSQAQAFVSYYLEDGDFVKFDNVTLGYNLDTRRYLSGISALRVYLSGHNLLCITDYKGLDPELSNRNFYGAGNDFRDKYPTIRSFTIGLNVTF